ncbi:MAG TPA: PhoPQ-activated protein PqaA family protein [Gammaproteobacteria bacterium]|nr:PhoPQ-activated protein PqaA family protein [Gammaproteobacteria bacterium]
MYGNIHSLAQYIAEPEEIDSLWTKVTESVDDIHHVVIEEYSLNSQFWPKRDNPQLWQHKLVIYNPLVRTTSQALLFVNGGTRNIETTRDNPKPHDINFKKIAANTQSVVVDLQDIPNQYLRLDDNKSRMGDALLAYTWQLFLSGSAKNESSILYFPMVKAVIKAMDAVQAITAEFGRPKIDNFVLCGLSKRALTAWLATLIDERVNGLIPVVMDILNTLQNMQHIYSFYNNQWPSALNDFSPEGLSRQIANPQFAYLMNLQDPLYYMLEDKNYYNRASVPKYIVSASGDDFFVPDSLNLYLDKLPGETKIRVVPNQSHFIDMGVVEDTLLFYYPSLIMGVKLPTLKWQTNSDKTICYLNFDVEPISINLWEAVNPERRDFRFAEGICYKSKGLDVKSNEHLTVKIDSPELGWKAYFIEVTFPGSLILTTSIYVISGTS